MDFIGYDNIGVAHHGRSDYFIQLNWYDQTTIGVRGGVVNSGWLYTRLYAALGGTVEYRMHIYEVGATDADSPLIVSSDIVQSSSETYQWLEIPFPYTELEAGKTYAIAFSQRTVSGGATPYFRFDTTYSDTTRIFDSGNFTAPSTLQPFNTPIDSVRYSAYVEYTVGVVHTDSVELFAPIDAIPVLTDGRNASGFTSGHQPKYTLDNDPDTWWKANQYTTSELYYDLGKAITVDAIIMWLHNYNENYTHDKAWRISYSSDDSSYTPIIIKLFQSGHSPYSSIVVDKLSTTISARYWRIEFLYFDNDPQTIAPEISAVWFMNDYTLPWKHQRPENNKILYHNNKIIARSGHQFVSPASIGKQRIIQRQFIFTANSNQWNNLSDAYHAAHGRNLPIVMQSELNSDEYYALHFETLLSENRQDNEFQTPQISFRELGYKRVPVQDRSLTVVDNNTKALWHFRLNGNDDSGCENHLTAINDITSRDYSYAVEEQGLTAVQPVSPKAFIIDAADATDFNMDMDSFTIEMWARFDVAVITDLIDKVTGIAGWRIIFVAAPPIQYYQVFLGDGSSFINTLSVPLSGIGNMQYYATVINRTTHTITTYQNGILIDGPDNIAFITGNISSSANLSITIQSVDYSLGGFCITRRALSANEIITRYAGRLTYGTWGM